MPWLQKPWASVRLQGFGLQLRVTTAAVVVLGGSGTLLFIWQLRNYKHHMQGAGSAEVLLPLSRLIKGWSNEIKQFTMTVRR